jgi:CheY-specific phosphatase CheX
MAAQNESGIPKHIQWALEEAFRVQLNMEIKVTASLENADHAQALNSKLDVMSIMGISSSTHTGSMALSFPKETFLQVLEKMIGEKHNAIDSQNADACAELLNIVYASARVKINQEGFDFQPAIPSTISGKELSLPLGQYNNFLTFKGETKLGNFLFTLSLKRK